MSKWRNHVAHAFLVAASISSPAAAADLSVVPKVMPAEAKAPDPAIGFSFYQQYATDYNFRGVSNSARKGSYQTFFELQYFNNFLYTAFYTWQTRLPTRPDFEFDLAAGIRPTFDKLSFDIGFVYYFYPNETRLVDQTTGAFLTTANSDFYEIYALPLYQVTPEFAIGAKFYYSPNFFGQHAEATYTSGTIAYTLPATWFSFLPEKYASGFSFSGEGGHYFLGAAKTSATGLVPFDLPSYNYGNVGISWAYKNLLVDLRYHMTDFTKEKCFAYTGDPRGYANGGRSNWCNDTLIGTFRFQGSTTAPGVFAEPEGLLAFFK
ncbi:TorF family putative porin [Methylorubrum aminovorans]|nr:TorF family putative porin [Methylorubrum aminovorans]